MAHHDYEVVDYDIGSSHQLFEQLEQPAVCLRTLQFAFGA
jgi:hypothetical protein